MAPRYVKLNEDWLLRGWTDIPWCLVNWRNGDYYKLRQDAFYVARSCDGQTDFGSLAFLPGHIKLLEKFITTGIAREWDDKEPLEEVQKYRQASTPMIRGILWAVTGRCNLKCRYCYMSAPSRQQAKLSFLDITRLVNQLVEANVTSVSLTGGEPFLREDLLDIIRLLASKKIRLLDIYTNGTLISDSMLKELSTLKVQPMFRISFDGCGTHDLMRGTQGIEGVVLNAIRRIRKAGFDVTVATSLDKTNIDSLMATYEQMKKLDLYAWGVARPQPVGCGRGVTTGLSLKEMADVCELLLHRWLEDGQPFIIGLEAFYSGSKFGAEDCDFLASKNFSLEGYACSSCRQWPYLAPDGQLLPCISYVDTDFTDSLPNLLENELPVAWNNRVLRSLLDIKKSDVIAQNNECATCKMLNDCKTGCRTSALIGSGNLLSKDIMACELWKGGYKRHFSEMAISWKRQKSLAGSERRQIA